MITKDDYDDNDGAGPSNPFGNADLTEGDEINELHKFTSTSSRRGSAVDTSSHAETSFIDSEKRLRILESTKDEAEV